MPSALTYPGVYIEEIPSGVRTISGVSTSVTAFIGAARRGPVNRAVRIQSFAEFERRFGGLDAGSEMSYGVRQFFANGGSDAWVVRVAKGATPSSRELRNGAGVTVLTATAREQGKAGDHIQVWIEPAAGNPNAFTLRLVSQDPENAAESRTEVFPGLSMSTLDRGYAVDVVNASSEMVTLASNVTGAMLAALPAGTSTSGPLTQGGVLVEASDLVDPTHNRLRISVNDLPPVPVTLAPLDAGDTAADQLAALCDDVEAQVQAAANGQAALSGFSCAPEGGTRIRLTSGQAGAASRVRVLPGATDDASTRLKLGAAAGGTERDGAADLVPVPIPGPGRLNGAVVVNTAAGGVVLVSVDGEPAKSIAVTIAGADATAKAGSARAALEAGVRAARPNHPGWAGFTAQVVDDGGPRLVLRSGTAGAGSAVQVLPSGADPLAGALGLTSGAQATLGQNATLSGGQEQPFGEADAYGVFIGSRAQRQGLYALEGVDLFNLLCLPGVADAGILADAAAYCQERRAFLIADARREADTVAEMVADASGTALPKSDHAAVYFPWVRVADPLAGGRLRTSAPSGTVAGVYARTDSQRGVWKAPAGTDAPLVGVQGVTYPLTDLENGQLNPLGVNCIRILPVYGAVPWGTRTLRGADAMASEWKYVPVRRLALYIEESLYRGTQWVVFEPNDEPLWGQIRLNLGAFMNGLFRQGAFQGKSPREAYFVKCDAETTTQADINLGVVNVLVGFAPLKPAEFVVIRLQQMAGQLQT